MANRVRSGIYFEGSAMRYAEIERSDGDRKLRRLGSCDFDFDAEEAVYAGDDERISTVREALSDVFSGTRSRQFTVVVPASRAVSFFSPISAGMSESDRLRHIEAEARLVTGASGAVSVTAEVVGTDVYEGEEVDWHHVAAMPEPLWGHLSHVLGVFEGAEYLFITRLQGAAKVASAEARTEPDAGGGGVRLVVGRYRTETEVGIIRNGRLYAGQVAETSNPADVCYHVISELRSSGLSAASLRDVLVYGQDDALLENRLASTLPAPVTRMDPLSSLSNRPQTLNFDPGHYLLCIGAAI